MERLRPDQQNGRRVLSGRALEEALSAGTMSWTPGYNVENAALDRVPNPRVSPEDIGTDYLDDEPTANEALVASWADPSQSSDRYRGKPRRWRVNPNESIDRSRRRRRY